jgi:DNA polymerase-3 subunit gamma/tau
MTYLVLARKYRPLSFDTLVGQDHVVRALTHALDTQRLHHAWLFTGTRGVGKTTLSRILAKSLNCETGITSKPCGVCRACTEIDAGRFVDYLELDAASNRGVDEMTQLLEQAVYSPGAGRFKVYMIDEVHMLTGHAFNAMLKTLEEPPTHVKFILATTDPQKIPVTVLSRCLQFNLKQMPPDSIVGHLQHVLDAESIAFQVPALRLIAQAASGSMRDALSLTDQAIAYSADNLTEEAVRGMLGTIDQRHLVRLLDALSTGDAGGVLAVADELATRGLSYAGALGDLAVLLSRIAIEQRVAGATPADDPLAADVARLAAGLHGDLVQLFYTVAVHSRGELALAPDEYAGFVMACLRMLALAVDAGTPQRAEPGAGASSSAAAAAAATAAASRPAQPLATATVAPATATPAPAAKTAAAPRPAPIATAPNAATPAASVPTVAAKTPAGVVAPATKAAAPASTPGVPPWEDAPASSAASDDEDDDAAIAAAPADDGPPAWVDESIPDDAEGGHAASDSGFTANPDEDDFETLAPKEASAAAARASADGAVRRFAGTAAPRSAAKRAPRLSDMSAAAWPELAARLPVTGLAAELARQSAWVGAPDGAIHLRVAVKTLADSASRMRLQTVLSEHFGQVIRLEVEVGATGDATAHAVAQQERAQRQREAEEAAEADPFVQALVADFNGRIVPGSIRAVEGGRPAV